MILEDFSDESYYDDLLVAYLALAGHEAHQEEVLALMDRRRAQIRTRNPIRNMALCSPRQSAWYTLFCNGDDQSFIAAMGLDRAGFNRLYWSFKKHFSVGYGSHRGGRPSRLSCEQSLGLVLQYYASAIELKQLGMLHGCCQSTTGRILEKAEDALEKALRQDPFARISWPSKKKQRQFAALIEKKYPIIKNRFGFVDGKNFKVQEPSDVDLQNAMYNGWLHSCLITGVICFDVSGAIIWSKHNCVGSWNDGDMSRELQEKLIDPRFVDDGFGIVADTAFPVSKEMHNKIISPLKENELERAHPSAQSALIALSGSITSLRQACEWGVGSMEKAWRQLQLPLPYNPQKRQRRLTNIFRLWNLRVRTTGITQIGNTFNN